MKRILKYLFCLFGLLSCLNSAYADSLDRIREVQTIRIAIFDSNPPFGFVNSKTKQFIGYDVDIANMIGRGLGVRVHLVPTDPVNRIPLLLSGKIDLIVANLTITAERAKLVDFSEPYFYSKQKFIARKGDLNSTADLKHIKIGANRGSVQASRLKERYPDVEVVLFDDTPYAFQALCRGELNAITEGSTKLERLLMTAPAEIRDHLEISDFTIADEYQAVAVTKGEVRLLNAVNQILHNLELSGLAAQIYDRWFSEKIFRTQGEIKPNYEPSPAVFSS